MPCDCSGMKPFQDEESFLNQINYRHPYLTNNSVIIGNLIEHLCAMCKQLTKEQMVAIHLTYPEATLLKWYLRHLTADYRYNFDEANKDERDVVINELHRLGYKFKQTYSEPNKFFEVEEIDYEKI